MQSLSLPARRFIIVGGLAVLTDCVSYFLLCHILIPSLAKGISFVLGASLAYILNNFWSFSIARIDMSNVSQFALLYSVTLLVNVAANSFSFSLYPKRLFAFIIATGISTVLNYVGQKYWVFNR